ncbi:MAG: sodium:alanine symporter family protein [Clostridia bacterium]|nr:sodium:alanine symporter family protein [Clostridia bacterium]
MEFFNNLIDIISGFFPFVLLILCGLYLSFKGRFFQIKFFPKSIKAVVFAFKNRKQNQNKITSLQAACTALSATVGTGNIAGVASAISVGGAGAIFWMWVSAILGMAVKYSEIAIAVFFRKEKKGKFSGGPMYYIKEIKSKFKYLSPVFAFLLIPAAFCTGNITQTNAAILSITDNFYIKLVLGIIFAFLVYAVILGGNEKIAVFTEKTIPFMSMFYIALCLGIIIINIDVLPKAFKMIFEGAFNPKAVTGGMIGSFLKVATVGASRGVFSNEAGLGTSAIAHSEAFDANSKTQGLYGIFEVFVDTILICTLTALTIISSGVKIDYTSFANATLVGKAFSVNYGNLSVIILAVMMCFFAFSSVIGWAVYGKSGSEFLFGKTGGKIFSGFYPLGSVMGAVFDVASVWKMAEFFNAIMLIINLSAILLLSDNIFKIIGDNDVSKKNRRTSKNIK